MTTTKDNLMASLMGEDVPAPAATKEDALFGDDEDDEPAPFASPPPSSAPPPTPSLLEQSGLLLGTAASASSSNGDGGGLFDDIDKEEEEKARAEEEAARLRAEQEAAARRRAAEEEEEATRRKQQQEQEEEERRRQEERMMQDQMQSIHLGSPPPAAVNGGHLMQSSPYAPQPQMMMQQQQQQQPYYPPHQQGFYRDHNQVMSMQAPSPAAMTTPPRMIQTAPSNVYAQGYYGQQQQQAAYRYPQQQQMTPNTRAGMYNANPNLGTMPQLPRTPVEPPQQVTPLYASIRVEEPLLIQNPSVFGLRQPPYWSYQITTELANNGGVWLVRRRFRHVVALEDRVHQECPGAILPVRPDKHATRAIEEASAQQSAEFAVQRAAELQVYLNQLAHHPVCHSTHALRLFLSLQDDVGTAWPEVSSNALTRLANVGVGAAVKLSETTAHTKFPWQDSMDEFTEDNAELLALQSAESVRMGHILQAVPKMEGAITLLKEHSEHMGSCGMELGRLPREVADDRELTEPFEILSNGMLRASRRSKRLALEIGAAVNPFTMQYKLCRYEKMAFQDRRNAIVRRHKERGKADQRAAQLMYQQRGMYGGAQPYGGQGPYGAQPNPYGPGGLDRMERDAVIMDEMATDAVRECEEIGVRLKSEVNRIAYTRQIEWLASVRVIAEAMKEASTERLAIWKSTQEQYLQAFPEFKQGTNE